LIGSRLVRRTTMSLLTVKPGVYALAKVQSVILADWR
jgi:hypothetical protein